MLSRLGRAEDAVYVERASLPTQRVLALAEVAADSVPYFAMVLVAGAAGAARGRE